MITAASLGINLGSESSQSSQQTFGQQVGSALAREAISSASGSSTDQGRLTREQWTMNAANQGSTLAAAIEIAAPRYVSGNEAGGWRDVLAKTSATVLARARDIYGPDGWWPDGLPDFYTDTKGATHQQIVAEILASAGTASDSTTGVPPATQVGATSTTGAVTGTGRGAQTLPGMTITASAPTNYTAWIIGAGVLVLLGVAFVAMRRHA